MQMEDVFQETVVVRFGSCAACEWKRGRFVFGLFGNLACFMSSGMMRKVD